MAKPISEKDSREQLRGWSQKYGCEAELQKIFDRYDDLLKGAKTKQERDAISAMGNLELHAFFGGNGELIVNGVRLK
jgi:hypothetical protein